MVIHKKVVLDEKGNPYEVIIPWDEFCEIEEKLGLDLEEEEREQLRIARKERESGKKDAYIELDNI
jgi:PHD/YefM family antitoxin component YafN of YafNO toxin-antitoxin module